MLYLKNKIMELKLERKYFKENYTIGKLFINDEYFCDTIEDKVRGENEPKVWGKTAIPTGRYQIIMNKSPKFGRKLPRLLNVKGFEGVLIHRGNTEEDTAGCIIVGENKVKGKVINSTIYENELVAKLQEVYNNLEPIYITIK